MSDELITSHVKTSIILIDFENVQPQDLAQLRGQGPGKFAAVKR